MLLPMEVQSCVPLCVRGAASVCSQNISFRSSGEDARTAVWSFSASAEGGWPMDLYPWWLLQNQSNNGKIKAVDSKGTKSIIMCRLHSWSAFSYQKMPKLSFWSILLNTGGCKPCCGLLRAWEEHLTRWKLSGLKKPEEKRWWLFTVWGKKKIKSFNLFALNSFSLVGRCICKKQIRSLLCWKQVATLNGWKQDYRINTDLLLQHISKEIEQVFCLV